MCDIMTSHLYHINNGVKVHTLYSHSETRKGLTIDHLDASYAEVEWKDGAEEPELRFPESWPESKKDECRTFYSKFNKPMELTQFLLPMAVKIRLTKKIPLPKALPKCKLLDCYNTEITSLPALPQCGLLDCSHTEITSLPALPKCKWLDCSNTKITSLPALPECKLLYCYNTKIISLPALPKCKLLYCSYTEITRLPALPKCKWLDCSNTKITRLPALPKCERLDCSNTKITSLPALPNCELLNCDDKLRKTKNI
jgi:hypothetical protein